MANRTWARILTGPPMVLAWGLAVVAGMLGLVRYQMTPGAMAAEAPRQWPRGLDFAHSTAHLTLVMTVHPECPCSRASLTELAELMSRSEGRLDARVLFVHPANAPASWLNSDLWRQAKAIPNVAVALDEQGHDAATLGATTSGQVMVYDASGAIRFSGGITDGRGHEGDNDGMLAILSLERNRTPKVSTAPVFGCSLGECKLVPKSR